MLHWVSLAVGVAVVAVLFIASSLKRYRGTKTAMTAAVVGSLGITLVFAMLLAQFNGFALAGWQILVGGLLAGVATLGGFLFAETRRVRAPKAD